MAGNVVRSIPKVESTRFADRLTEGMRETKEGRMTPSYFTWEPDKRDCHLLKSERSRTTLWKERWENQELQSVAESRSDLSNSNTYTLYPALKEAATQEQMSDETRN